MPVTLVTSLFSMNCKVKPSGAVRRKCFEEEKKVCRGSLAEQ